MNEENTKIDVGGSLRDATTDFSGVSIFAMVFLSGIGLLFAPWFADFAREGLKKKYNANTDFSKYALVKRDIASLKRWLWCVALVTWAFCLYAYWQRF